MNRQESDVQQDVQLEARRLYNCTLERNNSGSLPDRNGTPVRFGLGNISKKRSKVMKSSDLVGITPVLITQEMVGKTLGVFTAVEVKKSSWNPNKKLDEKEQAQYNWMNWVRSLGGFAGFANTVDNLKQIIRL